MRKYAGESVLKSQLKKEIYRRIRIGVKMMRKYAEKLLSEVNGKATLMVCVPRCDRQLWCSLAVHGAATRT